MTGDEIARQIINTLSVEYAIQSQQVMGMIHDCASTNNVALRTLKVLYPCMLEVGCFSHTLNHVGENFNIPFANNFVTHWVGLFSHSSPKHSFYGRNEVVLQFVATVPQGGGANGK